jgi:hypothetical protein
MVRNENFACEKPKHRDRKIYFRSRKRRLVFICPVRVVFELFGFAWGGPHLALLPPIHEEANGRSGADLPVDSSLSQWQSAM